MNDGSKRRAQKLVLGAIAVCSQLIFAGLMLDIFHANFVRSWGTEEAHAPVPAATSRKLFHSSSSSWYYPGGCGPTMLFACDYLYNDCDENARCIDSCSEGRWVGECVCDQGFEGDGETCEPIPGMKRCPSHYLGWCSTPLVCHKSDMRFPSLFVSSLVVIKPRCRVNIGGSRKGFIL